MQEAEFQGGPRFPSLIPGLLNRMNFTPMDRLLYGAMDFNIGRLFR